MALRNSVPHEWRQALTSDFTGDNNVSFEIAIQGVKMDITKRNQKECYNALIAAKPHQNPRFDSWARELAQSSEDGSVPQIEWEQVYTVPYKASRETKLQAFHYRIVQRVITCNSYLHKIRIKPSPKCSFCEEEDSITHFFATCEKVKIFWNRLNNWCSSNLDFSLDHLSTHEVILGMTRDAGNPKIQKLINWLLLGAKFYIHRQKIFYAGEISLLAFLREARRRLETEKLACIMDNRRSRFQTWQGLFKVLTP